MSAIDVATAVPISTSMVIVAATLYGFFVAYYAFARLLQQAELEHYHRLVRETFPPWSHLIWEKMTPQQQLSLWTSEKTRSGKVSHLLSLWKREKKADREAVVDTTLAYRDPSMTSWHLHAELVTGLNSQKVYKRRARLNELLIGASVLTFLIFLLNMEFLVTNDFSWANYGLYPFVFLLLGTPSSLIFIAILNRRDARKQSSQIATEEAKMEGELEKRAASKEDMPTGEGVRPPGPA